MIWHDINIASLQQAATARKTGYVDAVVKAGLKYGPTRTVRGHVYVRITDADKAAIAEQFALVARPKLQPSAISLHPSKPGQTKAAPKLPGIVTAGKNAASAAVRVITAAAGGQQVHVSETEFQCRMNICQKCDQYIPRTQRCAECSCFLSSQLIGKARLATEKCPLNKW